MKSSREWAVGVVCLSCLLFLSIWTSEALWAWSVVWLGRPVPSKRYGACWVRKLFLFLCDGPNFVFFFFNFMKKTRKIQLWFLSRNGAVRSRKYKDSKNAKGSTNTRGQRPRRAMARVLPGAPRLAAESFGRQRLGRYGSRRLLDGLAPPRRPTREAATGI